jgi:hypothetical protein
MPKAQQLETSATRLLHRSLGYFVTLLVENLPDGRQRISHARWHRKGLPPIELASDGSVLTGRPTGHPWRHLWAPGRLAWWIAILFNINTADAMLSQLTWWQEEVWIWAPDIIGSTFFLLSSYLAVVDVSHGAWSWQPRQLGWWIVMINLLGSIAFMVSAIANWYLPSSGDALWACGASLYTLLGALCFFTASYLMIPEQAGAGRSIDAKTALGMRPLKAANAQR